MLPEILYFYLYRTIFNIVPDLCVDDYCQNLGNCTSTWDKKLGTYMGQNTQWNYRHICECTPEYTGEKCEILIRKWYLFEFDYFTAKYRM